MSSKYYQVGLTLSGGGAKGIAHIGVIQALLDNNIRPEIISGASAGSIIGSLYAAGVSPDDMIHAVNDSSFFKVFRIVGIPGAGLIKLDYLKERMQEFIKVDSFEALKYDMNICATNMNLGKPIIFNSGTLFDKIMASCAVPWLFKPIIINGHMFADGGITNNMPAQAIRDKCDVLIGCNVKPKLEISENNDLDSFMGITQRCVDLSLWTNSKPNVKCLDVYIAPEKLQGFSSFNMKRTKEMCEVGYEETMKNMPKLLRVLEEKQEEKHLNKAA
jgi:NTE family protein